MNKEKIMRSALAFILCQSEWPLYIRRVAFSGLKDAYPDFFPDTIEEWIKENPVSEIFSLTP